MFQIFFSNTLNFLLRCIALLQLNAKLNQPLLAAYIVYTHSLNSFQALIVQARKKYVFYFHDKEDVFRVLFVYSYSFYSLLYNTHRVLHDFK